MASENRSTNHPLIRQMLRSAHEFEFFQLVDMLQRLNPEAVPIGHQGPTAKEIVRLRPELSLNFPTGDVADMGQIAGTDALPDRYRLTACFLGLYGTVTPLPIHYTEDLLLNDREDETSRAFLDLFHHRLLSLFFRTWTKYRYHMLFQSGGRDAFSGYMLALVGLGTQGLQDRLAVEKVRTIRFAGLMTQQPRSAVGLEGFLRDYFDGLPASIEQCVGRWLSLADDDYNAIGMGNCTLGNDLIVGQRVYDRTGKFCLSVGPVDFETYKRFLPVGDAYKETDQIIRLYLIDWLDYEIEVKLIGEEVPPLLVGEGDKAARLGWTSWVVSRPTDDTSVVFLGDRSKSPSNANAASPEKAA